MNAAITLHCLTKQPHLQQFADNPILSQPNKIHKNLWCDNSVHAFSYKMCTCPSSTQRKTNYVKPVKRVGGEWDIRKFWYKIFKRINHLKDVDVDQWILVKYTVDSGLSWVLHTQISCQNFNSNDQLRKSKYASTGNSATLDPCSGSDTSQHSNTQLKSPRQGHQHKQRMVPEEKIRGPCQQKAVVTGFHVCPIQRRCSWIQLTMHASNVSRPSKARGPKLALKLETRPTYSRFLHTKKRPKFRIKFVGLL
jgi:hypothetical protein